MTKGKILLSFDIEEFDLPREHGGEMPLETGIKISGEGAERILDLLDKKGIKATFFITGNFANGRPDLIKRMVKTGHEVACHGVDHFSPQPSDIVESKKIIEKVSGVKVVGYRQPRMQKINYKGLKDNNYIYDSSVNPAFIPGRYNHFDVPRCPYKKDGILEIPTSVATGLRVPLFWLALHLFPVALYIRFAKMSLKKTGYFATYFHPWEFAQIMKIEKVPGYIKRNSGRKLVSRLARVITELYEAGYDFETYREFAERKGE